MYEVDMAKAKKVDPARLLDQLLRSRGRLKIPQVQDLAAEFINSMGGVQQFAAQLVTEFNGAPVGSMQRAKILDTVMRGLKAAGDNAPDVSRLDTDDLRRLFAAQVADLEDATGVELSADAGPPAAAPGGPQAEAAGEGGQVAPQVEAAEPEAVPAAAGDAAGGPAVPDGP